MSASTQFDALAHVDLCSGIGGFAYGFQLAGLSKPVMFCDTEPWCRKILRKHWPDVPIADDVKELANDPERLVPDCDILTAGFPCQPWSVAGRSRSLEAAKKDPRHIWPWIIDIIKQKRPTWVIFENVPHLASLGGLDEVIADLEITDYAATTLNISAVAGAGAPHKRERLWIISRNVADAKSFGIQGLRPRGKQKPYSHEKETLSVRCGERPRATAWDAEPRICRVSHGVPNRLDRIKGLGNAIVPQIAQRIGKIIREVELQNECSNTV